MTKRSAPITLIAILQILPLCTYAQTTSGYSTIGPDMAFEVQGQAVGDWTATKLTIKGGVQEMFDNEICNALSEGTQRYNSAIHNYEYCNGSAWTQLGGDRPGTMCGVAGVTQDLTGLVLGYGTGAACDGHTVISTSTRTISWPPSINWDCPAGYGPTSIGSVQAFTVGINGGVGAGNTTTNYTCTKQ